MKLVSIIVPVYNVEAYLTRCINSLIKQTYKSIEIILVDDGSTDQSAQICDAVASSDDRIVVVHKNNGGLASARNCGLKISKGEYVTFVDSDDWIELDTIESMMFVCEKKLSDMVICGRYKEYDNKKTQTFNVLDSEVTWDCQESLKRLLLWDAIDSSVCDKLFRKSLFNNIVFPEGRLHEDIPVTYQLIIRANTITHIAQPKYHYYQRAYGITRSSYSPQKMDLYLFALEVSEYVKAHFPALTCEANFFEVKNLVITLLSFNTINCKKKYKGEYKRLKHILFKDREKRKNFFKFASLYEKIKMGIIAMGIEPIFETLKGLKGLLIGKNTKAK